VRRRSRHIVLVLIGAASLPACSPSPPAIVHDRYASLDDCAADWGRPDDCETENAAATRIGQGPGNGFGSPGRFLFRGPDYAVGERQDAQFRAREQAYRSGLLSELQAGPSSRAIEHAVPSIERAGPSRGGFGTMSHLFGRLG
jgi:uncharacterized protein YgiB involved in biofilm formation